MVKLLDCTLRDGGYVNDWDFGHDRIASIFGHLAGAGIDIIEVGFMDERRGADDDHTIQPGSAQLEKVYAGLDKRGSMVVGMIDYGTCDIGNIQPHGEGLLDGIRVIFKKEKRRDAIAFCAKVKELGYQVFVQAVSITSYDDGEFEDLLGLVNGLEPYAFSIVDTYGLLHRGQLLHYFNLADERLSEGIRIGYHSHNNFQLGYANCIELLEREIRRPLIIDGSLYGMGKSAGNTPIELLADYVNGREGNRYKTYHLLEAIDVTILDLYRRTPWGYSYKFFLSASNDCHPNYVSYLLDKKKLPAKAIDEILKLIPEGKRLNYDEGLIERLYVGHQRIACDDSRAISDLSGLLAGREVVLLGPGPSMESQKQEILGYIDSSGAASIAVNFIPDVGRLDCLFLSNEKRYVQIAAKLEGLRGKSVLLATSNVTEAEGQFDYILSYSRLMDGEAMIVDNPMIMLLKLLDELHVGKITLAGFDGYERSEESNYVNPNMEHVFSKEKAEEINADVRESLGRLHMGTPYRFLTKSRYDGSLPGHAM